MPASSLSLTAVNNIPLIKPGDKLADIIHKGIGDDGFALCDHDVVVVAQKVVSKAEGQLVKLGDVTPGEQALELAKEVDKDPRLVELILAESKRVVRTKPGVLIVEHRSGIVMANAGIDHSNVSGLDDDDYVTLLPKDADESAANLRHALQKMTGKNIAVVINDSVGRAWRMGTVGIAIGCSGLLPLRDLRGQEDLFGTVLAVSETADADSLASAACLLMGEAAEGSPVIIIRGYLPVESGDTSKMLIRAASEDMFR